MYLYYAEIDISELKFGVNRPQSWWDKRPKAVKMKKKLLRSIQKEGLRNPLSVRENDKGYVVEVGNQRLQALIDLGIQKVPCVINTKHENIYEINNYQSFRKLRGSMSRSRSKAGVEEEV